MSCAHRRHRSGLAGEAAGLDAANSGGVRAGSASPEVNDPWLKPGACPQPRRPGLRGWLTAALGSFGNEGKSIAESALFCRPGKVRYLETQTHICCYLLSISKRAGQTYFILVSLVQAEGGVLGRMVAPEVGRRRVKEAVNFYLLHRLDECDTMSAMQWTLEMVPAEAAE